MSSIYQGVHSAPKSVDSNAIAAARQEITKKFTLDKKENRYTPIPSATQRLEGFHSGGSARFSQTDLIKVLQERDIGGYAKLKVNGIEHSITQSEIEDLKSLILEVVNSKRKNNKYESFEQINLRKINSALHNLAIKSMIENLESVSQQSYQLNLLNKLLNFVESHPQKEQRLEHWVNSKYAHYIRDDNSKTVKTPAQAINLVCDRVQSDLQERGSLSAETAKDIGALMTLVGDQFKDEVVAHTKENSTEFPRRGDQVWQKHRNTSTNPFVLLHKMIFKNAGAQYAKIVGRDNEHSADIKGHYATSKFGPSLTVWHTTRFLSVCLKANKQEQKVYAATQATDWSTNNSKGGKYQGWSKGSHSAVEALMTFAHAVGESTEKARPRETLIRLILETRFSVKDKELIANRLNAENYDESSVEGSEIKAGELTKELNDESVNEFEVQLVSELDDALGEGKESDLTEDKEKATI